MCCAICAIDADPCLAPNADRLDVSLVSALRGVRDERESNTSTMDEREKGGQRIMTSRGSMKSRFCRSACSCKVTKRLWTHAP